MLLQLLFLQLCLLQAPNEVQDPQHSKQLQSELEDTHLLALSKGEKEAQHLHKSELEDLLAISKGKEAQHLTTSELEDLLALSKGKEAQHLTTSELEDLLARSKGKEAQHLTISELEDLLARSKGEKAAQHLKKVSWKTC